MPATKSSATPSSAVSMSKGAGSALSPAVQSLWKSYNADTSPRLKLIDAFLVFIMLTGIAQFVYCVLVTNFPFNAFLAGYVCFCFSLAISWTPLTSLQQLRQFSRPIRSNGISPFTSQPGKQAELFRCFTREVCLINSLHVHTILYALLITLELSRTSHSVPSSFISSFLTF